MGAKWDVHTSGVARCINAEDRACVTRLVGHVLQTICSTTEGADTITAEVDIASASPKRGSMST